MTDNRDIPTAKRGDRISLQTAPRPVMATAMDEQHSEVQVMGLVPNCADGARVAIGAGMRQPGVGIQMTLCALLDPQQALETAAMLGTLAMQAAMLRGEPLRAEPTPELMEMARQSSLTTEEAVKQARSAPGQAIMDQAGNAIGEARAGMGVFAAIKFPGQTIAEEGAIGVGGLTMPDGQEWVTVGMRQGEPGVKDQNDASASMPLPMAMARADLFTNAVREAAERQAVGRTGQDS